MSYKVFIRSTPKDIEVARDVGRSLQEAGVRVFPVEDTSVAKDTAAVTHALMEADEVIVILTDNSVNSPIVIYEMGAASGMHKRLMALVVNIRDSEIPSFVKTYVRVPELPYYIADVAKRAKEFTDKQDEVCSRPPLIS